ncbi:MAG: adenylate kinase [Zavarzinella sp.]
MRLVLVGPPGSGKGTQAKLLKKRFDLTYIGTGDVLREAIKRKTPHGLQAEPFIKRGHLVPDDLVNELVGDLFADESRPTRFVSDGYPRTLAQARWFDQLLAGINWHVDAVLQFLVTDEEVVRRNCGRLICPRCGTVYHVTDRAPAIAGKCDHDGETLVQRPDDSEAVIRDRLTVFHDNTSKLLEYYQQQGLLRPIESVGTIDEIFERVLSSLPTTSESRAADI